MSNTAEVVGMIEKEFLPSLTQESVRPKNDVDLPLGEDLMLNDIQSRPISWYRTPIDPKVLKKLHERSDWKGFLQTSAYLGLLILTGITSFYAFNHWSLFVSIPMIFFHGICCSFLVNAVHELAHGTVFKTKWLNAFFVRVLSFPGWINFQKYEVSHARHHRYTLHPPDDLEVVLPVKMKLKHCFFEGIVNYRLIYIFFKETITNACGKVCSPWELTLYPKRSERNLPTNWARILLMGHGLIITGSLYFNLWLIPLLTTFSSFYGNFLFLLCNGTQHAGLQDKVPDFRLCCWTFTSNPFVQFLYWHMNYHTEHHMYAAVPCYNLGKLHETIKHDLPPCPRGLIVTWKEIYAIQKKQAANPEYQHALPLPKIRI